MIDNIFYSNLIIYAAMLAVLVLYIKGGGEASEQGHLWLGSYTLLTVVSVAVFGIMKVWG